MELENMTVEELQARKSAICEEATPEADLDALETEVRAINAELESRKAIEAQKAEVRAQVAAGAGSITETISNEEKKTMTNEEVRKSHEYNVAFANYIKTNDDSECRALLTQNVSGGQVPVP